ncbi:MAG: hypothetical protein L3J96_05380, partial [Thermoplasmata archaeon]|nr:hypothetical protein [Thermoplasmata archaeon]
MRQRNLAALHRDVGEIGVSIAGSLSLGTAIPASAMQTRLRQAAKLGVDVFDLAFAVEPAAWMAMLGRTFEDSPGHPVILCPIRRERAGAQTDGRPGGDWDLDADLPRHWEALHHRLPAGAAVFLVFSDPSPEVWRDIRTARSLQTADRSGVSAAWGVAWSDAHQAAIEIPQAIEAGARIVCMPYNLLEPIALAEHASKLAEAGISTIVSDPFAGGRLDGSWLRDGRLGGAPTGHAPGLAELHDRFDPVTRLGFLTEGRRRTLPQAAVQVALATESVAAVAVPISPPGLLDGLTALDLLPPVSRGEWERWSRSTPSSPRSNA